MRTALRLSMMAFALLGLALPVWGQATTTAEAAETLRTLLDARGMSAYAARDPSAPDRFVGILYYKGSQLLAVSARYSVPSLLKARIDEGKFNDAYMDINCASEVAGKWFVEDLGADGLQVTRQRDMPFDIVYKDGKDYVVLNGDWAGQAMTEADYRARYAAAEADYLRMLNVAINAVRAQS